MGYHMVWKGGELGDSKTKNKEDTEKRPLEDGDQSMVFGLEVFYWCVLKRTRGQESSSSRWRFQLEFIKNWETTLVFLFFYFVFFYGRLKILVKRILKG